MRLFCSFFLLVALTLTGAGAEDDAPWAQPREFGVFQFLLDRSPFSLPTVEESSPLADRFSLSGAATLDGEAIVFVVDRTDQTRHMLTKEPNQENMSLVEYLPDPDPRKMKATIRVDGQTATIAYAEPMGNNQLQNEQPATPGMVPPQVMRHPVVQPRPIANSANAAPIVRPQAPNEPPRVRRVLRRSRISGQPIPGP